MTGRAVQHPLTILLRLTLTCPACGNPAPVGALDPTCPCPACGHRLPLDGKLYETCLSHDELFEVCAFPLNYGREASALHPPVRWAYGRCHRCQGCKTEFDPAAYDGALSAGGFTCRGCGAWHRVRPPAPRLQQAVPGLTLVVGEVLPEDRAPARPMVLPCAQCNATLQVDGKSRQVTCAYCDASNVLPDSLWRELHPAPTAPTLFLVCEGHTPDTLRPLLYTSTHRAAAELWGDDD